MVYYLIILLSSHKLNPNFPTGIPPLAYERTQTIAKPISEAFSCQSGRTTEGRRAQKQSTRGWVKQLFETAIHREKDSPVFQFPFLGPILTSVSCGQAPIPPRLSPKRAHRWTDFQSGIGHPGDGLRCAKQWNTSHDLRSC